MQKIRIDFDNPGLPPHLDVMEGDAQSRFFELMLFRSGAVYTAPDGAVYSLMYRGFGPQNQGWYDTIVDQAGTRPALVVDANKITCEIAPQAMVVPGHLDVVLCISTASGYMLKSWPIDVNVRNDHYDDTAETAMYFNLSGDFTAKIAELNTAMSALDDAVAKAEIAVDQKKDEALQEIEDAAKAASDAAEAARRSQQAAASSAGAAATSETNASGYASSAKESENEAKRYADSAIRARGDCIDQAVAARDSASVAKEYLEQVKTITTGAQGWYATPADLQAAVPIGENGWFAFVGTTDTIWTWDSDASAWVDTGATSRLAEYPTKKEVNENLKHKLDLSGGVMTGQISGSLSGSAAKDRENTMVFSSNAPKSAEESVCVVGAKTKDGAWVFGTESEKNDAVLSFSSDENYKNGSSERKKVYIPVPDENTTLFGITESSYDSANDSGCVRFGDGTQICYGGIHNAASGTKYVFALPFADDFEPKVIASRHYGSVSGGSGGLIWVYDTTSTSFKAGSASNMYGMWIAIGRYK